MIWQGVILGTLAILTVAAGPVVGDEAQASGSSAVTPEPRQQLFSGKVVLLEEALAVRDIKVSEEMHGQVVLETDAGDLIPVLADWRGRALFQDPRLRNRKVDLVGFLRKGLPYLQVQSVFTFNESGQREYMDYWCDICAIPMYEIKPCECCQGPIELRFQPRELPPYVKQPRADPGTGPTESP